MRPLSLPDVRIRRGATLTEVLMAILILSVGVSSVFALFPIAILQSIKATQLTNAKLMEDNAVEALRTHPTYLSAHLDGADVLPYTRLGEPWSSSGTNSSGSYVQNIVVTPTVKRGAFLPQPLQYYQLANAFESDGSTAATFPVSPGIAEPSWNTAGNTISRNLAGQYLIWTPVTAVNSWVVDPLGWNTFTGDGTLSNIPAVRQFGCLSTDQTGVLGNTVVGSNGWTAALPRWNGGLASRVGALEYFSHPDTWSQDVTFVPSAFTATSITFPNTVQMNSQGSRLVRLVVRNEDGTRSAARNFTLSGNTLSFPNAPLPASILANLGTATLESRDSRYSWFVTVNNSQVGAPEIHVAVMFQRKFLPGEEHVYQSVQGDVATFSSGSTELNSARTQYGVLGLDQTLVMWDAENVVSSATEPRPLIREGDYMFDPTPTGDGVQWYKITAASSEQTLSSNNDYRFVVVTLDRPVANRSTSVVGRAMFLRGLIEVFQP